MKLPVHREDHNIYDVDEELIATVFSIHNAEYFLRAGNLFPQLVEALEDLLTMLDFEGHAFRPNIEKAEELLTKAKL